MERYTRGGTRKEKNETRLRTVRAMRRTTKKEKNGTRVRLAYSIRRHKKNKKFGASQKSTREEILEERKLESKGTREGETHEER